MEIRRIEPQDDSAIQKIIKQCYPIQQEEKLQTLKRLRKSFCYMPTLEVVGQINNNICAHGMLNEAIIGQKLGLVFSFLEVAPEYQRNGLGTQLVRELLNRAQTSGYRFIAVQGEPKFFSNFGFIITDPDVIRLPFNEKTPLMIKELVKNGLLDVTGILNYD